MAGGPIRIWKEWETQILILLSFALQIFLFVFAWTRQRGSSAVLRILLWLAYIMADSTAVYTLGQISISSGSSHEHDLVVLWAPFLLLHLGSQDTITAYSLEDNELWPRHLLNLGVQAFGVSYVLYKHIAKIPTLLGLATGLIFVIGFMKYAERIWAHKCASMDNIQSSIRDDLCPPDYYRELPPCGPMTQVRDEEELLLFAQATLPVCKGAMTSSPVDLTNRRWGCHEPELWNSWNWKAMSKVVEMELSLMYDILYTKAAVIHTWYGYLLRLVSPLATITAFLLFHLSVNKDGYNRVDVSVTYILLIGAFLLDMMSVLFTLGSTWMCHFFWNKGWGMLGRVVLSLRRHVKVVGGSRGWSGSIGQFNLLHFCSRETLNLSSRVVKMMGLQDWWDKWNYTETLVISEDVKDLIFQRVWQALKMVYDPKPEDEIQSTPYDKDVGEPIAMMPSWGETFKFGPEDYEQTASRRMTLATALDIDVELQEAILTLHILTDGFLLGSGTSKDSVSSTYLKAVKALSNYMMFLMALLPYKIPGLELRGLYELTCDLLLSMWLDHGSNFDGPCSASTREEKFASIVQNRTPVNFEYKIISQGNLYVKMLLELVDVSNPDKSGIISHYESNAEYGAIDKLRDLMPGLDLSCRGGVFDMPRALALILDGWVRLLMSVSVRCGQDTHAKQINRGGELMTVVWLMEEHAAIFFKPSIWTRSTPL